MSCHPPDLLAESERDLLRECSQPTWTAPMLATLTDDARDSGVRVFMYLFDIIHLGGFALEKVPLRSRKKLLKAALHFKGPRKVVRESPGSAS